jgi:hypothetical protein
MLIEFLVFVEISEEIETFEDLLKLLSTMIKRLYMSGLI